MTGRTLGMNIGTAIGISLLISLTACKKKVENVTPTNPIAKLEADIKATPSFENHIALGLEYANNGMRQQALDMYVKARDINPNSPLAWNNMCAELNTQKRHIEALEACEKAVALDGNFQLAKNNLMYTRDLAKASKESAYEKKKVALAKGQILSPEAMQLGFDFYNIQDFSSAIEIWKLIQPNDAEYAKAQNNIATSYILTREFSKADASIAAALKLEPTNQLYLNNQRWLASEKEKAKTTK